MLWEKTRLRPLQKTLQHQMWEVISSCPRWVIHQLLQEGLPFSHQTRGRVVQRLFFLATAGSGSKWRSRKDEAVPVEALKQVAQKCVCVPSLETPRVRMDGL